ncbi:helix-turn-helix domain-containing protein [Algoriphagus persicinus]|uniref:helix-turn-helix domain-containing protein n=1 Tax=Algoriphagus persicinus TaxID=3108754 RepID=UPI002B374A3E|nr:helix-turn-helix domain-containing protein [Algoriphagus sp. E1-3-M2]MEB2784434.1 helix-turn-helix domain-containing protein [Algoriphagus sp. E1-3-M2]
MVDYCNSLFDFNAARDYLSGETDTRFKMGGDAKIAVGNGMNLDLTFNPDFSNVEVDEILTNLTRFELIHFELKMQPAFQLENKVASASKRIASMFMELLERQFPVDDLHSSVKLRTASDFAAQLNLHVNHLNRSVKEITQKTTSALIAERLLQESKVLLRLSSWNVSGIAYALGYSEVTHFNNFFKKQTGKNPTQYRKSMSEN